VSGSPADPGRLLKVAEAKQTKDQGSSKKHPSSTSSSSDSFIGGSSLRGGAIGDDELLGEAKISSDAFVCKF
jgi:hypothetical protein